ncbi:MAG TPA: hypothetical protein VFE33_09830 [Thermoanaerobaculia bacterium]|nr:hypothetical protein [Thermoanaerobaculia bacterium]
MTKRLIFLAVLFLIPAWAFAATPGGSAATAPLPAAWLAVSAAPAAAPALDLPAWLASPDQPQAASSCGPNFCTQAQRTQCAQTCHHAPFVGLQCCSNCTTICNCGSVPIEC